MAVDFKKGSVTENPKSVADDALYVFINDGDFVKLFTGQLPLGSALMNANLKIKGNLMLLPALEALTKTVRSKL